MEQNTHQLNSNPSEKYRRAFKNDARNLKTKSWEPNAKN